MKTSLIVLIAVIVCFGCEKPNVVLPVASGPPATGGNYELVVISSNSIWPILYELNKSDGTVRVISRDAYKTVRDDSLAAFHLPVVTTSAPWTFDNNGAPFTVTVELKEKWKDGKFCYVASAYPYHGQLEQQLNAGNDFFVTVDFRDADGFVADMQEGISIPQLEGKLILTFTRMDTVENDRLVVSKSFPCDFESYSDCKSVRLSQASFGPHITPAPLLPFSGMPSLK